MPETLIFEKQAKKKEILKKINPTFAQEVLEYFYYFLRVLVIVTFCYSFIKVSVFEVINISGMSMYPTYLDKDIAYIDKISNKFSDYQRGEVVIIYSPPDANGVRKLYIKRIIGLPGEKVVLESGKVYIYSEKFPSGVLLDETNYLVSEKPTYKDVQQGSYRFEEKVLEKNEYYLMGDNRTGSTDSRAFGPVIRNDIVGKVFYESKQKVGGANFKIPKYNIPNQN